MLIDNLINPMIGADPEFILVDNNDNLIQANSIFSDRDGIIGTDGNSTIGEIRPRPSTSVLEVVADLSNIINETANKLSSRKDGIKALAGHYVMNNSIGGHIHIGYNRNNSQFPASDLISRLDKVIIGVVEKALDDANKAEIRRSGNYGKMDFRSGSHFNLPPHGLEYRPAGSWLLSPEVATIYLGMAKAVYFSCALDLPAFVSPDKTFLTIVDNAEKLPDDCKIAIKLLADIMASGKRLDWSADILQNWKKGE